MDHYKGIMEDAKVKVDEEDRDQIVAEAARRDPRIVNLLDMRIKKRKGLEREDDFLLVPVYDTDRGENIASKLRLKTRRRVKLDDYGWTVWESINGKRDVREIGEILRKRFGDEVEPLYPRLSKFLAYLNSLKLIKIERRLDKKEGEG